MYDEFDPPSPQDVQRGFFRWLPATIVITVVVVVLGGGLAYAGHAFGWWLSGQDATHQAENSQAGYANQTTLREQVTAKLADIEQMTTQIAAAGSNKGLTTAVKAQRAATAGIVCSDAAQISGVPLPAGQAQWVAVNCQDGTVSPHSTYYVPGAP